MSAELRENISKGHSQLSLASLADAADALAKAAATLAAAARATVEAFSMEMPISPVIQETQGINLGKGPDDVYKLISDAEQVANTRLDLDGGEHQTAGSEDEIGRLLTDVDTQNRSAESSHHMNQPYRLLVDTEADVLLFVCALIDKRRKVICYMPCGTNSLKTYKQLIENVTETHVYMLTSSASSKLDQSCTDFIQNEGSVLLVPESLSPDLEIKGENSWVIHVGWPVSEHQYTAHRNSHRAQTNLLVAYSGDQSLYPSGDFITNLTEPWPQNGASFRSSVSILRPLYEVMLSEISLEMKSRVYQDWIQFRGIHGPRRVEAWTMSTMVKCANKYLLEVLLWSGSHTGGEDLPLPEVSPGFVTQNGLESAVQEGLLRVEDGDLDPQEPSRIPTPEPESTLTATGFQLITGHTYFAPEEDFDAIPLMCFIAGKYNKVICFLEGHGALRHYQRLFTQIAGRHVMTPTISNNQANDAIAEVVTRFLSATAPTVLLLAYTTTNLPTTLATGSIDCCMYWGLNSPLRQAKKNRTLINCATTIIIMTPLQQGGRQISSDLGKHPSAGISLDYSEHSILAPMRNKTKQILVSDKSVVRDLYTNRVYGVGAIPRQSLSAEDAIRRANQYAARVLLYGDSADGSEMFPPVEARPHAPRTVVEKFQLQQAVDAGLLTVVG